MGDRQEDRAAHQEDRRLALPLLSRSDGARCCDRGERLRPRTGCALGEPEAIERADLLLLDLDHRGRDLDEWARRVEHRFDACADHLARKLDHSLCPAHHGAASDFADDRRTRLDLDRGLHHSRDHDRALVFDQHIERDDYDVGRPRRYDLDHGAQEMKAISLWQPWASLVAVGVKTIETRSWPAPKALIGERLAIHATAKRPPVHLQLGDWSVEARWNGCAIGEPDWQAIVHRPGHDHYIKAQHRLPFGKVVASCILTDCVPIRSWAPLDGPPAWAAHLIPHALFPDPDEERLILVRDAAMAAECRHDDGPLPAEIDATPQIPFGDFTPGRYAWLFSEIASTTERCPWCWGDRCEPGTGEWVSTGMPGADEWQAEPCVVCDGAGKCEPILARGRQRVWNWTPAA